MQTERTDRVWFVTFDDIRPGNGARLFLQPGACTGHLMAKALNINPANLGSSLTFVLGSWLVSIPTRLHTLHPNPHSVPAKLSVL